MRDCHFQNYQFIVSIEFVYMPVNAEKDGNVEEQTAVLFQEHKFKAFFTYLSDQAAHCYYEKCHKVAFQQKGDVHTWLIND